MGVRARTRGGVSWWGLPGRRCGGPPGSWPSVGVPPPSYGAAVLDIQVGVLGRLHAGRGSAAVGVLADVGLAACFFFVFYLVVASALRRTHL